jgi:hypothetical protein
MEAESVKEKQTDARGNADTPRGDGAAAEPSDGHFSVERAFAKRGLELASLTEKELQELEESTWERLSPVFDAIVERWQEEHGQLSEAERIDRELRRLIVVRRDRFDSDYECEGCSHRDRDGDSFVDFHGLFLCDGCTENARLALRGIQLPLIEVGGRTDIGAGACPRLRTHPPRRRSPCLGRRLRRLCGAKR